MGLLLHRPPSEVLKLPASDLAYIMAYKRREKQRMDEDAAIQRAKSEHAKKSPMAAKTMGQR